MAYLMLVVGLAYSAIWGMGLLFSSKSDGPRNTIVPALGLLGFLGLSGMSAMAAKDAMDNPERLTPAGYMGIAFNQTIEANRKKADEELVAAAARAANRDTNK